MVCTYFVLSTTILPQHISRVSFSARIRGGFHIWALLLAHRMRAYQTVDPAGGSALHNLDHAWFNSCWSRQRLSTSRLLFSVLFGMGGRSQAPP